MVEGGRPSHSGRGVPSGRTVPLTAEVHCGEASTNAIDEGSLRSIVEFVTITEVSFDHCRLC